MVSSPSCVDFQCFCYSLDNVFPLLIFCFFLLFFLSYISTPLTTHYRLKDNSETQYSYWPTNKNNKEKKQKEIKMQNFIRVSRGSTGSVLRTVVQANNNNSNNSPSIPFTFSSHNSLDPSFPSSHGSPPSNTMMVSKHLHFYSKMLLNHSSPNELYDPSTKVRITFYICKYKGNENDKWK